MKTARITLLLLSLGAAGILTYWYVFAENESGSRKSEPIVSVISKPPSSKNIVSKNAEASNKCTSASPIFSNGKNFTPIDPKIIEEKIKKAYENPEDLALHIRSSPESAIALFNFVSSCYPGAIRPDVGPIPNKECPKFNVNSYVKLHPIEILGSSAEQGNIDAKLLYMINAPLASAQLRQMNTAVGDEMARNIIARAQRYGDDAARAGSRDAMMYMSHAYEVGQFGTRDMEKAYLYALPLGFSEKKPDNQRISDLASKLTSSQRNKLKQESIGCDDVHDSDTLKNPFG